HFLGPIPYPEVISEIRCLDVALIPHLDNPISRNMDPMKLYLFLGLGIPIVSTRFSGIEKFGEFIHVGNDAESIIHMINKVLNQDSSDLNSWREKVLLFLKDHTWENRVSDIFNAIDNMR
ncbi:hypothetical protein JW979_10190, partial [bacterium]|nr:hypothetical protein [candidate division CSSED10-310 bacterium]